MCIMFVYMLFKVYDTDGFPKKYVGGCGVVFSLNFAKPLIVTTYLIIIIIIKAFL